MRKANPNTHQGCRSLLQKAVRRGEPTLVAKVVAPLYEIGDIRWLRQPVGMIIAEACWPLRGEWELPKNRGSSKGRCEICSVKPLYLSYLSLGGIPSRALLESKQAEFTMFQTDATDRENSVWDKVLST